MRARPRGAPTAGSSSAPRTATSTRSSKTASGSAPPASRSRGMALPPGPPLPAPLQTLLWITRPLGLMEACRERYGDVFTLRFTGLGVSQRIVFVADPAGVRTVFGGDPEQLRAGRANVALGALLGEHSLLLLDGREHLRQRKLMLPPFHGERMRGYETAMRDITNE